MCNAGHNRVHCIYLMTMTRVNQYVNIFMGPPLCVYCITTRKSRSNNDACLIGGKHPVYCSGKILKYDPAQETLGTIYRIGSNYKKEIKEIIRYKLVLRTLRSNLTRPRLRTIH